MNNSRFVALPGMQRFQAMASVHRQVSDCIPAHDGKLTMGTQRRHRQYPDDMQEPAKDEEFALLSELLERAFSKSAEIRPDASHAYIHDDADRLSGQGTRLSL